jgi:hypothetical protein
MSGSASPILIVLTCSPAALSSHLVQRPQDSCPGRAFPAVLSSGDSEQDGHCPALVALAG